MLEKIPDREEIISLIGEEAFLAWKALCTKIEETYDMDRLWNSGGKAWSTNTNTAEGERPSAPSM